MNEIDIYKRMGEIAETPHFSMLFGEDSDRTRKIADHREWLKSIRHERPSTDVPFKVAIYIRYFNQTRYDNYLAYHKKQFADTVALCPKWTLVDFYIDEGATAPNMENAPEWSRLLCDAMVGKVDLIITQKVSNVSKKMPEVTFCSRILAKQKHPVGIYFISEDIFTLASYYKADIQDKDFLPEGFQVLPEPNVRGELHD